MPSAASSQIRLSPHPAFLGRYQFEPKQVAPKGKRPPAVHEGHRLVVNRANADRTHLGSVRFSNCRGDHG